MYFGCQRKTEKRRNSNTLDILCMSFFSLKCTLWTLQRKSLCVLLIPSFCFCWWSCCYPTSWSTSTFSVFGTTFAISSFSGCRFTACSTCWEGEAKITQYSLAGTRWACKIKGCSQEQVTVLFKSDGDQTSKYCVSKTFSEVQTQCT